ncbi:MAG TPA: hypothetical protein PKA06_04560 [Gemmatales bacterium]|nr:hypothetical protein [Gemmatales bacterium]
MPKAPSRPVPTAAVSSGSPTLLTGNLSEESREDAHHPARNPEQPNGFTIAMNVLTLIVDWCHKHAEKIQFCFMETEENHARVKVVTRQKEYDFAFLEEIAALECIIFSMGYSILMQQIPYFDEEELKYHVHAENSRLLYAYPQATSGKMSQKQTAASATGQ